MKFSRLVLFASLLNLAIAPAIYANSNTLDRGSSYAIGLLLLLVFGLAIYLTMVIIQPERF
jgi:K+-transporting ATPase KdpF subunit